MKFVDRFVRLVGVLSVIVLLIVAATYALASALLLSRDDVGVAAGAGEASGAGTEAGAADAPTTAVPPGSAASAQSAPDADPSAPAIAETAVGTVSCARPDGGDAAGPFSIQVAGAEVGPEPLVVAVDLVTADGLRLPRTVEVTIIDPAAPALVTVADSAGPGYTDCEVLAVQQGDRVILTS